MPKKHLQNVETTALSMPQLADIKRAVLERLPLKDIIARHNDLMYSYNETVAVKAVEMGYKLYGAFEEEERTAKTLIVLNIPQALPSDAMQDAVVTDAINATLAALPRESLDSGSMTANTSN